MTKITSYNHYYQYFHDIALHLAPLNLLKSTLHSKQFYEFSETFKGTNLNYPALILVPPRNGILDNLSDNIRKTFVGEVWVLDTVKKEDIADRHTKLTNCEIIIEQIIAKLKDDHKNYSLSTNRPIQDTDYNRWVYEQLGPQQNDNLYGYSFEFQFNNAHNLNINTSLWI